VQAVTIPEQTDPERLMLDAQAGDREAFRALVEPHVAAALGASIVILRSHADAADAVQDALLSAWLGLPSVRDPVAFPAWFRRHAVRAALRGVARRRPVVELDLAGGLAGPEADLHRAFERRELLRAFDQLVPDDRVVLTLRHLWDLPGHEIADVLGIPEGTVKSRVHAALGRLRAAFDAEARR
jgi:RNA polymerase sigma-70 factor (ECF subfamily)